MGAGASQAGGPHIHHVAEGSQIAAHGKGQDRGRVVGRGKEGCVKQVLYPDFLSRIQKDGDRIRIGNGRKDFFRYSDLLLQVQVPLLYGFHCQKGRHDLCDGCGIGLLVRILLIKGLARIQIDQDGRIRFHGKITLRPDIHGNAGKQGKSDEKHADQSRYSFFHMISSRCPPGLPLMGARPNRFIFAQ